MRIRQALATVAVLAAATGSLSACNDSDPGTKDAADTASSSASESPAASESPSDDAASSGHLDKDGLVQAITVGQREAGSAHVSMTMSGGQAMTAEGDVDYQGKTPEMQMTMNMPQMGSGKMELRFVDGLLYMSMPPMTPAGKFLKIDPSDKSNPLSQNFGSLTEQMDPLNSIKAMQAGVQDVKFVGEEKVQGEPADHYTVTVDTAAMMKATKQKAVPGMPETLTYDMWLDDQDLLRRMQFDLSGLKMDMLMSHWGEPVAVKAPPAGKIVDTARMAG
jgi:lipoprotein LprG